MSSSHKVGNQISNLLKDGDQPQPRVARQSYEKTNSCNQPYSTDNSYRNLRNLLIATLFKMKNYCIRHSRLRIQDEKKITLSSMNKTLTS